MSTKFTTVVFDMDGVLVDSEAFYYERRKNFLQEYGLTIEKIPLRELVGADMRSLWDKISETNEKIIDKAAMTQNYLEYKKNHPLNYGELIDEDAKRVLQYLKRHGYKIGLASSSTNEAIQEVLDVSQLNSYFDVVVSGENFKKSKPEPDIYLYVLAELAVTPEECLAIEDSEKGIASANSAGLTVWAMEDKRFGMDQSQAHDFISQLSDICKKLEND